MLFRSLHEISSPHPASMKLLPCLNDLLMLIPLKLNFWLDYNNASHLLDYLLGLKTWLVGSLLFKINKLLNSLNFFIYYKVKKEFLYFILLIFVLFELIYHRNKYKSILWKEKLIINSCYLILIMQLLIFFYLCYKVFLSF